MLDSDANTARSTAKVIVLGLVICGAFFFFQDLLEATALFLNQFSFLDQLHAHLDILESNEAEKLLLDLFNLFVRQDDGEKVRIPINRIEQVGGCVLALLHEAVDHKLELIDLTWGDPV